jgi:hypothetical protein
MKRFRALGTWQRVLVVFVAAAAAFGIVSVVQASISGPNGVINACYQKNDGRLRVVSKSGAGACESNEKPLSWNVGSKEYAYIYDLSPPDLAATVAAGAAVPFANNGSMTAGIAHTPGNSTITFTNAGVYRVEFIASVTEPGQLVLALNGIEIPSTVYGRATGTSEISGQAILSISAGDVLTLRNPTGNSPALTFTPNAGGTHADVSASIVIEQVG